MVRSILCPKLIVQQHVPYATKYLISSIFSGCIVICIAYRTGAGNQITLSSFNRIVPHRIASHRIASRAIDTVAPGADPERLHKREQQHKSPPSTIICETKLDMAPHATRVRARAY